MIWCVFIMNWQQVHKRRNRFEIPWLAAILGTKFPKEQSLVHKTAISCATQNIIHTSWLTIMAMMMNKYWTHLVFHSSERMSYLCWSCSLNRTACFLPVNFGTKFGTKILPLKFCLSFKLFLTRIRLVCLKQNFSQPTFCVGYYFWTPVSPFLVVNLTVKLAFMSGSSRQGNAWRA